MIGDFDDKFDSHAADRVEAECPRAKGGCNQESEGRAGLG